MTDIYKLFEKEIWKPEDYTECFWYEGTWELSWSDEGNNPDEWEESYSFDSVRQRVEKDGYVLVTGDDGCGGQYQAIFDLSKKIDYE